MGCRARRFGDRAPWGMDAVTQLAALQEIEFRKVNPELLERNQRRIEALIEAGDKKKAERGVR